MTGADVHDVVRAAGRGELPDWAVVKTEERRAHMARVAELLGEWAAACGGSPDEVARWRGMGYLHDALREEDPAALRPRVPPALRRLPDLLLHGPAAAERLRVGGVEDGALLHAVTYHTIGEPRLGRLGRFLYAADFLEPGRTFLVDWRAERRARMPDDVDRVVYEIAQARIAHLVERGSEILPQTVAFWNRLVEEQS